MEHKFVSLQELKMSNDGPGTIEGYRAIFVVDEGGDLLVKGAFLDTIDEYLNLGFTAHSHDWTFAEAVGFPLTAKETETGWFVKSQFHSTQTAQDVRTIAKERMKAGKQVGFSFGYSARDYEFIDARDYERELPRYSAPSLLDANMKQAQRFPRVRILKKVDVLEDSIVTAPMNKLAAATGVKYVRNGRLFTPASTSTDALSLRSQSYRIRAEVMKTLYLRDFDGDSRGAADLRAESERIRARIARTLSGR